MVILLDALDELTPTSLPRVLRLITQEFVKLPQWICLFVTSRDDAQPHISFSKFELRICSGLNANFALLYLGTLQPDPMISGTVWGLDDANCQL